MLYISWNDNIAYCLSQKLYRCVHACLQVLVWQIKHDMWRQRRPTRCNNQMFIINFCLNMFRASLCPSSGEQRPCYCMWCTDLILLDVVGSGCGALRFRMRALFIINFCLNMFRALLCPSSGEQRPCYCMWCTDLVLLDVVGSGCGPLRCRMRALFIINFCLNMFRASLCPPSGEQRPCYFI